MAKRGRPRKTTKSKKKEPIIEFIPEPTLPEPELIEAPPFIDPGVMQDRIMRYRRTAPCPKCGAHPVVCIMRRANYAAFRCRQCDHRWEVG